MQGAQTHISAALKDVVVLDVNPRSVHKKVSLRDTSKAHYSHFFPALSLSVFFLH